MKQGLSKEQDKQHLPKMEPLKVKVSSVLISMGHSPELLAMAEHCRKWHLERYR